ncbi:MAG: SRPBCC family protein [Aeromicrobium sp.]
MNPVTSHFSCPPDRVFAVLADGWLYPTWVVGAARMRDVDASWPSDGATLHHSVGSWPAMLDDTTTLVEWNPPTHAVLKARGWPFGTAMVRLTVEAAGAGCTVTIEEDALEGPGRLVPKPLRAAAIKVRNVETLKRLAFIAENRT